MSKIITDAELSEWQKFPKIVRNHRCFNLFREKLDEQKIEPNAAMKELLDSDKSVSNSIVSSKWSSIYLIRNAVFFIIWACAIWYLLTVKEKKLTNHTISGKNNNLILIENDFGAEIGVTLTGFLKNSSNTSAEANYLTMTLTINTSNETTYYFFTETNESRSTLLRFPTNSLKRPLIMNFNFLTTRLDISPIELSLDAFIIDSNMGAILAGTILLLLNIFIVFEFVHRTLAALLAAFTSIGVLTALNNRPTMNEMIKWIDYETLLLIFSMMVLVVILTETGVFDYIAVYIFQLSRGKVWRLINMLCVMSAIISAFLDNVTTILLITPITIRLFECMQLNPVPVLPFIILNVNIAGLSTLIGHPPNLMITNNSYILNHNITFFSFAKHMSIGVVLALIQTNLHLRIQHKNIDQILKIHSVSEFELHCWRKCLQSINRNVGLQSLNNILIAQIEMFEQQEKTTYDNHEPFQLKLKYLRKQYPIRNRILLKKTGAILIFVISLFFFESIPKFQKLSLGWCAFAGVLLLLLISDCHLDTVFQRVEWVTLLFFGAMFIIMECLARLGLIDWIGRKTEILIVLVDEEYRLTLALLIILWISALTSTVVDSIPVTAMMVKIVASLAQNETLQLPVKPMVFALAFGPTLGGNGSLYGASSNIVAAGVSEKLGHKITFFQYFKVGFPVMLGNVVFVSIYLIIAHVYLEWN